MFESPRWYITDALLAAVAQEKHTAAIRGFGAQTGVGLQPGDSQWFHRAFGAQTGDAARQRRPTNIDVVARHRRRGFGDKQVDRRMCLCRRKNLAYLPYARHI